MQSNIFQFLFSLKNGVLSLILFCFFISFGGHSQNLIVNGNFGTFNSAILQPAKLGYDSNYNLINYNAGNSTPRQYAITNNPKTVNTANFKNLFDHTTGDGTGNMMAVDGDSNEIFWKQNPDKQLQAGQTYTFSFYYINVNNVTNALNPAPTVKVNFINCSGCPTPTFTVGNSATGWTQYVTTITPASTAYVRIELSTVNAGGGGNDFAIDDISLIPPPQPLTISNSLVNPTCPTSADGVIVAYPNGGVAPFSYTLAGTSSATNSTGIFQGLAAGSYSVSVTDSNSPPTTKTTGTISVVNPANITLSAAPTGCVLSGTPITLTAANGGTTYNWSTSTGIPITDTDNVANVNPLVTTTYSVSSTTISPTTNANLIGNPSFENGTSGFYSDYTYSTTNTSGAQFAYGIVKNANNWFSGFISGPDHSSSGFMLVADGATSPNSVIWSQAIPVETSKTYTFSFWVQALVANSPAQFQVLINDSPISISPISPTNGGSAGWNQISGTWNSGVATIATIKIIDSNIASGGNDFALDDISFSAPTSKSCPLSAQVTVNIGGSNPITTFSYTTPVCKNGTNPLPTGISGFVLGGTYTDANATGLLSINSSTGEINLSATTIGTYTIKYSVAANPSICQLAGSSTFQITINNLPNAGTDGNTTICDNSLTSIDLFNLITGEQSGGNWTRASGSGGTFNPGTGIFTPSVGATTSSFVYTLSGISPCVAATSTATVNINTTPILTVTCGSPTATSVTFNWNAVPGATAYNYTYTASPAAPVSGIITSLASTVTYTVTGLTSGQNVAIIITPVGSLCPLPVTSNCVASNCPLPSVNVVSKITVCVNQTVIVPAFSSTPSGATFNWSSNNTLIGIASSGSGNIASFKAKNTTTSIQTATISVTASNGICTGPATTFDIVVNPEITPPTVVSPLYYCQNSPSVALTASSLSGATLNWYATATSTPALASAPIPSRNTVGSATYYVSQSVGSCESARVAIVVNVVADTGAKADILRCDPSQATAANTVFIDWSHVPGRSTNDYGYSYSIAGAPLVFGRTPLSSLEIFGVLPEDSVTFTILDVPGVPCYVPQTITTTKKAVFNTIPTTICNGAAPPSLPLLSDNGVSGNWLPAQVSNTATGTYVFTPDPTLFPCAISFSQKITVNPLANAGILSGGPNVCLGSTTLFSSTVSGGTWSSSDTAIATVSNIGLVTGVGSGTATIFYTALGTGGCLQDQKSLPITVSSPPNAGTLSGGPNVCLGSTTLFSSTVSGGSWSSSNTAIATVSNTGLVTGVGSGTATIFYTALGTGGCLQDQKSLPITVSSPPNAGTLSGGPNVCLGSTTLLSSTVSGGTWSSSDTAIATVSNTGLVTGVTSGTAFIRYTVLGSGVCPSAYQEITVVVNPSTVPTFSSIGPLCAGTEISLPTASIEGTTGTWSPVFNATKTLSYTFTPSTGQCATTTKLTVTIIALPVATATPKNSSICSDTTTAISISSGIAGTTYTWNVVQTNVTGALAGSGDTIAQTLKATVDNKSGEAVYSITPTANGCPGLPILSTVTVNPIPDVSANPSPATVCSGEQTAIILTSKVPGTTFSWTADPLAVIGSSSDTGSTITQTLVTNSLIPGTVDYTITPKANSCVGLPIVVNVTVNPTPEVFGSGATVICSGESTNIILSPKILGTDFTWTVLPKGVTGAEDGGGSNTINQILEAGSTVGTAEYTITPILNGCQGNSIPIVITVNPSPEPVLEDGIICVKENTGTTYKNYLLDTGLSNSLYDFKWFKDDSQIDGASSNTYEVTEEGLYSVIATNTTTSCISEEEFARVIPNYPAVSLTTTITDAFTPEATITVNPQGGTGPFLYRLDEGPLQSSNVFVGVSSGVHKVWIEDAQGCTYLSQVVTVIDYPKYFTPNGDGFNDTWNVIGLNDQPDAKIYIFDRYGKLLKQISTIGGGWNGTFNGYELPGSDYWFTIEYLENDIKKLFKAHFSLKR